MSSFPVEHRPLCSQLTSVPCARLITDETINLSHWSKRDNLVRQPVTEHWGIVHNLVVMAVVLLSFAIGLLTLYVSRLMLFH